MLIMPSHATRLSIHGFFHTCGRGDSKVRIRARLFSPYPPDAQALCLPILRVLFCLLLPQGVRMEVVLLPTATAAARHPAFSSHT